MPKPSQALYESDERYAARIGAPPPPYPPQEDQPIRLGPAGSPWPICAVILAVGAVFLFLFTR